jgi:hypothetical protein
MIEIARTMPVSDQTPLQKTLAIGVFALFDWNHSDSARSARDNFGKVLDSSTDFAEPDRVSIVATLAQGVPLLALDAALRNGDWETAFGKLDTFASASPALRDATRASLKYSLAGVEQKLNEALQELTGLPPADDVHAQQKSMLQELTIKHQLSSTRSGRGGT